MLLPSHKTPLSGKMQRECSFSQANLGVQGDEYSMAAVVMNILQVSHRTEMASAQFDIAPLIAAVLRN